MTGDAEGEGGAETVAVGVAVDGMVGSAVCGLVDEIVSVTDGVSVGIVGRSKYSAIGKKLSPGRAASNDKLSL
jgi:hypothetical protein